jgi:hypothetical protein
VLKAAAFGEAERLAAAALDGALNPALSPAQRSKAALAILDAVDPPLKAELTLDADTLNPEGVGSMGLRELQRLAESIGLDPSLPTVEAQEL